MWIARLYECSDVARFDDDGVTSDVSDIDNNDWPSVGLQLELLRRRSEEESLETSIFSVC